MNTTPCGIEVLLKKAAVDPAFREQLLARRAEAAGEIGLKLTPGEAMLLRAAPRAQLAAMIAATRVPASAVPALLGKAAIVMLAALGLNQTAADSGTPADQVSGYTVAEGPSYTFGVGPDRPNTTPPKPPAPVPPKPAPVPPKPVVPATKPAGEAPKSIGTPEQIKPELAWGDYYVYMDDGRKIRCNYTEEGANYVLIFEIGKKRVPKSSVTKIEKVPAATQAASRPATAPAGTQPSTPTIGNGGTR